MPDAIELKSRLTSSPLDAQADRDNTALASRLVRAKRSFACRRVNFDAAVTLNRSFRPRSGDIILARIEELGHHKRLESPEGRRVQLYPGDEIVVAYGARYAPDQFEACLPEAFGPCDLVASGGIAAKLRSKHSSARRPTSLTPIGGLSDHAGAILNLAGFSIAPPPSIPTASRNVIGVVGTSMNAGKTTTVANIVRGLRAAGARAGACKVTGTGSGGDLWAIRDAGADHVLDFTDVGYATTAGADPVELESKAHELISHLEGRDLDIILVELADGLLQRETNALLSSSSFTARFDGMILAAADPLGAIAGAGWMHKRNLPLRAITGRVTASSLAIEEIRSALETEVLTVEDLTDGLIMTRLCREVAVREPRSVSP